MTKAEKEFNARFSQPEYFDPKRHKEGYANGFSHPYMPVILDNNTTEIVPAAWGLIPGNKTYAEFKANTLNARIEDVHKTWSYKNYIDNRCLILADYFIEYKHIPSAAGKKTPDKIPYKIFGPGRRPFAMAGIFSMAFDEPTFTILTTEANTLMAEIHNSAKRMPVVLRPEEIQLWLHTEQREKAMTAFHNRHEVELEAIPLHGGTPPLPPQGALF